MDERIRLGLMRYAALRAWLNGKWEIPRCSMFSVKHDKTLTAMQVRNHQQHIKRTLGSNGETNVTLGAAVLREEVERPYRTRLPILLCSKWKGSQQDNSCNQKVYPTCVFNLGYTNITNIAGVSHVLNTAFNSVGSLLLL
jgi:hypothetical protein